MRQRSIQSESTRDSGRYGIIVAAAVLILISTFAALATGRPDVPQESDARKLIKQAAKMTRAGSFTEAEQSLRQAIANDAQRSDLKVELAFVLHKQRRLGEAYDLVFPIVQAEPKNSRAFAVLGATLLASGRFRDARHCFFNAIRLDRRNHLAWAGFGMLEFYENRIADSVANLREAVFHAPGEPDYLFSLAQVTTRAELYSEAADAYRDFLNVANNTDAERRARIKGLISFLRYLGHSGTLYKPGGSEETKVKFDLVGNRPVVEVRLNGEEQPLKFVLDTGSGVCVLSDATAKKLKIKPVARGGHARGIGGNGKFEIVYGLVKELAIGDVNLRQVPVYIRTFHNEAQRVDGYIGLALISKFLTTIDYGEQTFSLTRRSADQRVFRQNDEISLPLRLTSSGFLSGEVVLEGLDAPLNFIVDTGASISVISDYVAKHDAVSGFQEPGTLRVIGSAGITNDVQMFRLPKVTFGTHTRKDITAAALDLDIINEASGFEQSGILGGNFLKNYRMTFDFKNSKVVFEPVRAEN